MLLSWPRCSFTASTPARVADEAAAWPLAKRVGFRFLAAYFVLYTFPFPLGNLPLVGLYPAQAAHYERPEPGVLVMSGTWQGKPIEVRLRERDLDAMLLISRGYHWINELPYNR